MTPRGRQHLSLLRDKIYINTLKQNSSMTARQVNKIIGGSLNGTLSTLKKMHKIGLIRGTQIGNNRRWEFWVLQ